MGALEHKYGLPYLPRTYFCHDIQAPTDQRSPPPRMVLAEWLEGFLSSTWPSTR